MHQLEDYSGYAGEEVVLVFDGYQSDRKVRTEEPHGSLTLVFTCHGETADAYIERLVAQTPKYRSVRVATSDGLEQSQVLATGATRMTSRELLRELRQQRSQGLEAHQHQNVGRKQNLAGRLSADMLSVLEKLRRG
jgi:predicted RNA-binding protein with PIN domain